MTAAPSVAELTHRLAGCPPEFLATAIAGGSGEVSVAAVVGDAARMIGADLPGSCAAALAPGQTDDRTRNWLQICLVAAWLLTAPGLAGAVSGPDLLRLVGRELWSMSALVEARLVVSDPDRREELVRATLRSVGVVPAGETAEQAADRLSTLDSAGRARVESAARAAEERAREVREALARKAAEEAAARAFRE
jgi:hypothetical protein